MCQNVKTCAKSKEHGDFAHQFTFGASSDGFFVMNAEKLAILAGPISTLLPAR
jgi:hypothetical protein